MHITKEYLLVLGLIILFTLSIFCGHFGIGVTGDMTVEKALPSSGWDVVTTGLTWIVDALTFQLTDMVAMVGSILWIWIVITIFIPIVLIVRGD
jgi:hypothetical protein